MKVKVKVKSLSPVRLVATPWTAAYQAPLSMEFSYSAIKSKEIVPFAAAWMDLEIIILIEES